MGTEAGFEPLFPAVLQPQTPRHHNEKHKEDRHKANAELAFKMSAELTTTIC